jgi:hypothetical protein
MQTRSKTTQTQNQPSLVVNEDNKTQTTPVSSNIPASNTSASTTTIEFTIQEPEVNKKLPNTRTKSKPNAKSNLLSRCIGRIASHINTNNPAINTPVEPATKEPEANKKPSNTRAKSNAKSNILSRCIGRIASHMNTRSKTKAAASKPSVAKPEPEVNKKPMNTRSKSNTSSSKTTTSNTASSQSYPNSTIEFTIQELEENNKAQNRSPQKIKCVIQIYLENSESL